MPTQAVHLGNTTGIAQVLEGITGFNCLDGRAVVDKSSLVWGDLGPTLLLRKLINCKKRDLAEKKIEPR